MDDNEQQEIINILNENYPQELVCLMGKLKNLKYQPPTTERNTLIEEYMQRVEKIINQLIFKAICPIAVFNNLSLEQTNSITDKHTQEIVKEIKSMRRINGLEGNN